MSQFGNTATPAAGFVSRGDGTNQVWSQFTMPSPGGLITTLHAYFGTFTGGTATCDLCVWDSNGNLLGTAAVSVPQKPSGAGAQQWNQANCSIYVPAGTCYLGFWTPSGNGFTTSSESGGGSSMKAVGGSPASVAGGVSTGIGALGVYADYTPGEIFWGDNGGVPHNLVAIWYGDASGVPHTVAGVWAPVNPDGSGGVKRIW